MEYTDGHVLWTSYLYLPQVPPPNDHFQQQRFIAAQVFWQFCVSVSAAGFSNRRYFISHTCTHTHVIRHHMSSIKKISCITFTDDDEDDDDNDNDDK